MPGRRGAAPDCPVRMRRSKRERRGVQLPGGKQKD